MIIGLGTDLIDITRIATLNGAIYLGQEKNLGSIQRGKLADLLLVDGAPEADIADLRKATLVIKDGVLFDPKKLYAEIGVAP